MDDWIIDQSEETSLYKAHCTQSSHIYSDSQTVNMSIALLDELLFWMRCKLRREAREAAERFIKVLEGSERESRPMCMNDRTRKNNSSTKEENQSKEMGTREVYDHQQQKLSSLAAR